MTTTAANLRIGLLKALDDYITGTVTTGTSSTVFIDTGLADYTRIPALNDWVYWLTATTAGNALASRRISAYNSTTYQITMNRALTGTTTLADTFQVMHTKPSELIDALNQARVELFPNLCNITNDYLYTEQNQMKYTIPSTTKTVYQVRLCDEVSTDVDENILESEDLNPNFEEWTGTTTCDHWTATNVTLAHNDNDDFVWDNDHSCECLVAGSTTGTLTATLTNYAYYSGMKMSFKIMAYCGVTSRLRASISDGTTTTYSSYHQGNGWEELSVSAVMQATPTAVTVGVSLTSGTTAVTFYLDSAILTMGQRTVYTGERPIYNWKQSGTTLELPYEPAMNQRIHIIGAGYLTSVSADTDSMETEEQNNPLLYEQAMLILYQKQRKPNQDLKNVDSKLAYHMGRVAELKRSCSMRTPIPQNGAPDWAGY